MRRAALLLAVFAAGCATSAPPPAVETDPDTETVTGTETVTSTGGYTVPTALPAQDDPLGVLRPDADTTRDDITITLKPYTVTGSTPDALLDADDGILSTVTDAGDAFVARVDWRVNWRFAYVRDDDDLCRAEDVTTALSITYQLPDWQPAATPEPGLRAYWERFEDRLWTHEYGHALIGYRAKQEVQATLSAADVTDEDCDDVGERLNAVARAITDRGRDAAYDAATRHGRTQGATFSRRAARAAIAAVNRDDDSEDIG